MLYKPRTPEEIDKIIERAADYIIKYELDVPADLLLETYKPFAYVGGRLGGAGLAFLIPIIGYSVDDYMVAFNDPENVDKLLKLVHNKREVLEEKANLVKEDKPRKKWSFFKKEKVEA